MVSSIIWLNQLWGVCAFGRGVESFSSIVKVEESISDKAPGNRRAAVYPGSYCLPPVYTAVLSSWSLIRKCTAYRVTYYESPAVVSCNALGEGLLAFQHEFGFFTRKPQPSNWYIWMITIYKNCIDNVYEGVNVSEKVDSFSTEIWLPQPKTRSQISLAYKSIAFGNGNVFQLCQCVNIICIAYQRKEMGTKYWTKPLPDYGAAGPRPQASDPFCEHDNCKQVWSPNLLLIYGWGGHNSTYCNIFPSVPLSGDVCALLQSDALLSVGAKTCSQWPFHPLQRPCCTNLVCSMGRGKYDGLRIHF